VKADFVENEHPRDKGGEFTGKGGEGAGGKMEKPVKVVRSEKKADEGEGDSNQTVITNNIRQNKEYKEFIDLPGAMFSKKMNEEETQGIYQTIKNNNIPTKDYADIYFTTHPEEFPGWFGNIRVDSENDNQFIFVDKNESFVIAGVNNKVLGAVLIAPGISRLSGENSRFIICHEIGHGVPSILDNNPELFNKVIATIKQTSSVDYGIRSSSLNDEKELKADLYAISKIGKEELKNKIAKDLFGFNNLDSLFEEPNE
jgi:hypothetical protein